MKKIELNLQEFDNFRKLAKKLQILFFLEVIHGQIIIEANTEALENLGY